MSGWHQVSDWHDPFFQYPRTVATTSGGDVELPIFFPDASSLALWYFVEPERAAPLISIDKLDLILVAGKALVNFCLFEYRQSTIGPYNEAATMIAVKPKGAVAPIVPLLSLLRPLDRNVVGFEVIDLPVTTEASCVSGREIWSFPKFVADIALSQVGKAMSGSVRLLDGKGEIVSLSGVVGPGVWAPVPDMAAYQPHRGRLERTHVNTRGGGRISLPGTIRLHVGNSDHIMTKHMNQLALDGRKPAGITTSRSVQMRVNQGAPIA
jgi:hypothetical protein